jgi:hypothetical protein
MKGGMDPDGERIIAYRSPGQQVDKELSFEDWSAEDELPPYQDHVEGFNLSRLDDGIGDDTMPCEEGWPTHTPDHPAFGPGSIVKIPVPKDIIAMKGDGKDTPFNTIDQGIIEENSEVETGPRRTQRNRKKQPAENEKVENPVKRPARDRWFYQEVVVSPAKINVIGEDIFPKNEELKPVIGTVVEKETFFEEGNEDLHHELKQHVSELINLPEWIGPYQDIEHNQLDGISNDEIGASFLQGTLFFDEELEWCMVSGWGVESGSQIVFYLPLAEINTDAQEHHASLSEVIAWIKGSPPPPAYRGYKSSTTTRQDNNKT